MKKARPSSRCNRGTISIYAAFSLLLLLSLFLLFTSYAAGIGTLSAGAQEQFHVSLLAGRISNLASLAEHHGIESETTVSSRFLLYGIRPANYTLEDNGTLTLKSDSAQAQINTNGAAILLSEAESRKTITVRPR